MKPNPFSISTKGQQLGGRNSTKVLLKGDLVKKVDMTMNKELEIIKDQVAQQAHIRMNAYNAPQTPDTEVDSDSSSN